MLDTNLICKFLMILLAPLQEVIITLDYKDLFELKTQNMNVFYLFLKNYNIEFLIKSRAKKSFKIDVIE